MATRRLRVKSGIDVCAIFPRAHTGWTEKRGTAHDMYTIIRNIATRHPEHAV